MKLKLYIFFLMISTSYSSHSSIKHSIYFNHNSVNLDNVAIDKTSKTTNKSIKYDNLNQDLRIGFPIIPYKDLMFFIPDNQSRQEVNIISIKKEEIKLDKKIQTTPNPIPTSINAMKYTTADSPEKFYNPNKTYPETPVNIISDEYYDGNIRIITVRISPMQYNERDLSLILNSKIEFEIAASSKSNTTNSKHPIKPRTQLKALSSELINIVNNDEFTEEISRTKTKTDLRSSSSIALPFYKYIVITSESLAPAFERLISWKRSKGLSAGIITMQTILNDPSITGDEISNIQDDAGKLRQYLTYAWQNGAEYILLGGQDSIVPVRYGAGGNYSNSYPPTLYYRIPSDLYFSELNGNWNIDGDSIYGEVSHDMIEYSSELSVGRVLCKNKVEVSNFVNKVIVYERNPGLGNSSYLENTFYTQNDQLQRNDEARIIKSDLIAHFDTSKSVLLEEDPTYNSYSPIYPNGVDVISKMNDLFGLYSWFGHGDVYGISSLSQGVNERQWKGITSLDSYKGGFLEEIGNGLDSLKNQNHPAIAYTIACDITPFDKHNNYTPDGNNGLGYYHHNVPYSFGEAFTVAGDFGGPVFLGNTRHGWVQYSTKLYQHFINALENSNFHLGKAEALSKSTYNQSFKHYLALSHNLIGCPEIQLWTNTPSNIETVTITQSGSSININTTESDCCCSINGLFGGKDYHNSITGSNADFYDIPSNFIIAVNKHNQLPYIAPIYIQNEQICDTNYIFANEVHLGNNVTNERASGNVTICNGASLTIETPSSVTLAPGFTVEMGGSFRIITN